MREDGGLISDGVAAAVYYVPAVARSNATLPAVLWTRVMSSSQRR
jgi:hypothetical protein